MRKFIAVFAVILAVAGMVTAQTRIGTVKSWTPPKLVDEINDQLGILSDSLTATVTLSNVTHLLIYDGLIYDTSPTSK